MSSVLVHVRSNETDEAIRRELNASGNDVASVGTLEAVKQSLRDRTYDAAVIEVRNPGDKVLELIRDLKSVAPETALIMLGADWPVRLVVEAMKEGLDDFLDEPFDTEKLYLELERVIERRHLANEVAYLRHNQDVIYDLDNIIAVSDHMKSVLEEVRRVAASNASVVLLGETGTGKEVVAGAIHYNSARRDRSFIKVNCAALPDQLLESELFGHEKGAFTGAHQRRIGRFEQADGGTIFLDEIVDMSAGAQAKILRVLEQHEFERLGSTQTVRVDVRILAATNKDLLETVNEGQFRKDLYYRLNVVTIKLAPLRERVEDIKPMAEYFLKKFASQLNHDNCTLTSAALRLLESYKWPGNVRQLRNVIERAVIMAGDAPIMPAHLALDMPGEGAAAGKFAFPEGITRLEDIEKYSIEQALIRARGVQKDAAQLLGISPRVINYKIKKHQIDIPALLMGE